MTLRLYTGEYLIAPTTLERVEFARITKDGGICCDEQGIPLMAVSAAGFREPGIDASLCHWNGD